MPALVTQSDSLLMIYDSVELCLLRIEPAFANCKQLDTSPKGGCKASYFWINLIDSICIVRCMYCICILQ